MAHHLQLWLQKKKKKDHNFPENSINAIGYNNNNNNKLYYSYTMYNTGLPKPQHGLVGQRPAAGEHLGIVLTYKKKLVEHL